MDGWGSRLAGTGYSVVGLLIEILGLGEGVRGGKDGNHTGQDSRYTGYLSVDQISRGREEESSGYGSSVIEFTALFTGSSFLSNQVGYWDILYSSIEIQARLSLGVDSDLELSRRCLWVITYGHGVSADAIKYLKLLLANTEVYVSWKTRITITSGVECVMDTCRTWGA